jgi:aspartate/methionine/tyrosine aminotransferase
MGATVLRLPRRPEDGWRLDLEALGRQVSSRTRLIILTSPHNPSGAPIDGEDLCAVGAIAAGAGALVLVDEVYLDAARAAAGIEAVSAATLDGPFLVTSSLTKSFGLAGLRCGWIVACTDEVAERIRRTRDVVDNASSAPVDRLGAHAFTHLGALTARARAILGANLAHARSFFDTQESIAVSTPLCASVCFPRLQGVADATTFIARLDAEAGVAVTPGRFFDAPAHFRISLAGRPDRLAEGLDRIRRALG